MTKQEKIYRIFMTSMIVIIAGLLLATGIIAVQKSMKLSVGVSITPSMLCKITDSSDNVLFCNTTKNSQSLYVTKGASISGNMLTLNKSFSNLGGEFALKIYNYTTVATSGNVIKVTTSGTGVETTSMWLPSYSSGTPAAGEINVTAVARTITLQFEEVTKPDFTVTYNLTGCTKVSGATSVAYGASFSAEFSASTDYFLPNLINVSGVSDDAYSWNPSTGIFSITDWKKVSDNIEITVFADLYKIYEYGAVGAVPADRVYHIGGNHYKYYIEMGEYPQSKKADNVTITKIISGTEGTTGAIGTGSDGATYVYKVPVETSVYCYPDGVNWFKVEPVRWTVLGGLTCVTDGSSAVAFDPQYELVYNSANKTFSYQGTVYSKILLLAEQALTRTNYDYGNGSEYSESNTDGYTSDQLWSDTDMYKFLNVSSSGLLNEQLNGASLLDAIFTETQQQKILGTKLYTGRPSFEWPGNTTGTVVCPEGMSQNNKLFLLADQGTNDLLWPPHIDPEGDSNENFKYQSYLRNLDGISKISDDPQGLYASDYARACGMEYPYNVQGMTYFYLASRSSYRQPGDVGGYVYNAFGTRDAYDPIVNPRSGLRPCFCMSLL